MGGACARFRSGGRRSVVGSIAEMKAEMTHSERRQNWVLTASLVIGTVLLVAGWLGAAPGVPVAGLVVLIVTAIFNFRLLRRYDRRRQG